MGSVTCVVDWLSDHTVAPAALSVKRVRRRAGELIQMLAHVVPLTVLPGARARQRDRQRAAAATTVVHGDRAGGGGRARARVGDGEAEIVGAVGRWRPRERGRVAPSSG